MSSLRDIMDVDVDPLESQAIQRSRESALSQSQVLYSRPAASPSPNAEPTRQSSMRRKRSNRVSKSSSSATTSRPGTIHRRSSAGPEYMEPSGYGQPSASPTGSSSNSTTMRPTMPRGMEAGPSIRYTPVTGRISRAKKGQPVHICDLCDEPRAFTRAEHLRRHQLSHQQARFPCTFQDCEKAFHRPDLLARHMNRHETQGEKPYKASDNGRRSRDRSSSASSIPRTPPQRILSPATSRMEATASTSTPPSAPAPRGSADMRMAREYEPIMGPFQAVNVSGSSNQRPPSRTDASDSMIRQPSSTATGSMSSPNLGGQSNFRSIPMSSSIPSDFMMNQTTLGPAFQSSSYQSMASSVFEPASTPQSLPLLTLQVPDQAFPPSLAQTNSPPYNSSESTWSTPSDVSRQGNSWPRDRSLSVTGNPGGGWVDPMAATPQFMNQAMHVLRQQPSLEIVPENFETPYAVGQSRHYSSPMVMYQSGLEQNAIEGGRSDLYQNEGHSRGYPPSNGQFMEDRFYWWT